MRKEDENRLTDAIIDLGVIMSDLKKEVKELRNDLNHGFNQLNHRVEKLEKQQVKTNLTLGEMRISYMKSDESFNKYALRNDLLSNNHETRLARLEEKTPGSAYPPAGQTGIASEPAIKYSPLKSAAIKGRKRKKGK